MGQFDRQPGQSYDQWMAGVNSSMAPTGPDDLQAKVPPPSWVMQSGGYRGGIGTAPSFGDMIKQKHFGGAKARIPQGQQPMMQQQPMPAPMQMPYQNPMTPQRGAFSGGSSFNGMQGMNHGSMQANHGMPGMSHNMPDMNQHPFAQRSNPMVGGPAFGGVGPSQDPFGSSQDLYSTSPMQRRNRY